MHQTFVSTARPPKGIDGDNENSLFKALLLALAALWEQADGNNPALSSILIPTKQKISPW